MSQAPTEVLGVSPTTTPRPTADRSSGLYKGNEETNPYVLRSTTKERAATATPRFSHPFLGAVAGFCLQFPHLLGHHITSSIILSRSSQLKTSRETSNGLQDFPKRFLKLSSRQAKVSTSALGNRSSLFQPIQVKTELRSPKRIIIALKLQDPTKISRQRLLPAHNSTRNYTLLR